MRAISLEQCGKIHGKMLLACLEENRVEVTPQNGMNETLILLDGKIFANLEGRFERPLFESLLKIDLRDSTQ